MGLRRMKFGFALAFLLLFLFVVLGWNRGGADAIEISVGDPIRLDSAVHSFFTEFPNSENPISEGGNWSVSNGDFANVKTTPHLAFGTQTGTDDSPQKYNDSTAILNGKWGPDQFEQIVVHHNGAPTNRDFDEVEIRLRSTISATSNTGYEINCRTGKLGMGGYIQVGKSFGPLGKFSSPPIAEREGPNYSCHDGDVLTAMITGTTIKVFINGEKIIETKDATFATGNPGIGFYHEGHQANNSDFGISGVFAADAVPKNWKELSPFGNRFRHTVRHAQGLLGRVVH